MSCLPRLARARERPVRLESKSTLWSRNVRCSSFLYTHSILSGNLIPFSLFPFFSESGGKAKDKRISQMDPLQKCPSSYQTTLLSSPLTIISKINDVPCGVLPVRDPNITVQDPLTLITLPIAFSFLKFVIGIRRSVALTLFSLVCAYSCYTFSTC